MQTTIIIIGIVIALIAGVGIFFVTKKMKKDKLLKLLSYKLVSIRLPKTQNPNEQKNFKEEINATEQLFSILGSNPQGAVLEAAVHHVGEEIHFYAAVPQESIQFISRQIEGLFKDAKVELCPDYNIFQTNGATSGMHLSQKNHFALPIRTYVESESDTFSPIISTLSKIAEIGEGAALQCIIQPADSTYKKTIGNILKKIKQGESLEDSLPEAALSLKAFSKTLQTKEEKPEDRKEKVVDQELVKALERKVSKTLVEVNMRVVVSTTTQRQTDDIIQAIASSFSQFEAPMRNKCEWIKAKNIQKFTYQYSFREFVESQRIILNTEELASMFHLPSSSTLSPKIKWLKSKEAAPPSDLPESGVYIGSSVFQDRDKKVCVTDEDRRRHIYIIGQTGTGKSALMDNMAVEDIKNGKGVCVIDPHGELIDSILGSIPKERIDDVIIVDPGNLAKPIGLNMLEYDITRPEEKTFIVNEIQGIFNKLFTAETMGPMFEQYMRNALLLLMEDSPNEPATLIEVPRLFTDEEFRKKKLERIKNPVVLDFWQKEAIRVGGEASLNNMTPYITSKFNNFIANDYIRPIIGQTHSSFNFRQIMDEEKILLVNLSKGKIGELNSALLGMIIIGKLMLAAFSRGDLAPELRKDFNVYIDEFQNFTTDSISIILSEARKYRLNLVIAHQFIAQLTEKIRDSVFGNVGSLIAFRVGPQDAEFLVKQFEPIFSQNDLINIDNLNAYVKLLVHGQTSKPFNIKTPLYPQQDREFGRKIKEFAMLRYGADRHIVENDIMQRLRN